MIVRTTYIFLLFVFYGSQCYSAITQRAYLGLQTGLPSAIGGDATVRILPRFHMGLTYGLVPPGIGFPESKKLGLQTIKTSTVQELYWIPTVSPSASNISPYIRYFPSDNNFYFQVNYSLLNASADITGSVAPGQAGIDELNIPGEVLTGNLSITQHIVTVSIGHLFASKAYFFGLNIGASFLASLNVDASLEGQFPDALGTIGSEDIASSTAGLETNIREGVEKNTGEFLLIPTIQFVFGIFLF